MWLLCTVSIVLFISGIIAENSFANQPVNSDLDGLQTGSRVKKSPFLGITCDRSTLLFTGRDDMVFRLFNNQTSVNGTDISHTLGAGVLIPNAPIKFLIHGFWNNANSPMPQMIKDAFMSREEDYNVITVDWSKGSGRGPLNYINCLIPTRIVPLVGKAVAEFIKDLIEKQNVNILYVNIIGHSLGAQAAGRAGKALIEMGYKLPIIVGLDPALPGFNNSNVTQRLASTDADYVEVIHTNSNDLGYFNPIGTADFYPNWGHDEAGVQPGCLSDKTCSHARAFEYFAESVKNPHAFEAIRCYNFEALKRSQCGNDERGDVTVYMGGPDMRQNKAPGVFYLETFWRAPFGRSLLQWKDSYKKFINFSWKI